MVRDTENDFPASFYTMLENGGLKVLSLTSGRLSLGVSLRLLNSIDNSNCNLEKFEVTHEIRTQDAFSRIIFGWAEVLKRNSTIKSLCLHYIVTIDSLVDFRHEYSKLLCDQDTVEATYNSNHSLGSIDFWFGYDHDLSQEYDDIVDEAERRIEEAIETPLEIRLLLDLNKDQDKTAVARRKILQVHFSGESKLHKFHQLNLAPTVVPCLLSWIGKQQSELSLMNEYLQNVPALIEGAAKLPEKHKHNHK
jgi:hypothetical protein